MPWNSDGARVLDIASGVPKEIARFLPRDIADPTGVLPPKAYVVSVALLSLPGANGASNTRDYVVLSDVNSGLYALDAPWSPKLSSSRLSPTASSRAP